MAVMVTGHRKIVPANLVGSAWPDQNPIVAAHHLAVKKVMAMWITSMRINFGEIEFISGMALGADQLFAETVVELKASGLDIHLIAAVPFVGQESKWPASSQAKWQSLIVRASHVQHVCDPGYAPWKMQKRNEWMGDHSNRALAVWDGAGSGGTWNCISYLKKIHKPVEQLHPMTLKLTVA